MKSLHPRKSFSAARVAAATAALLFAVSCSGGSSTAPAAPSLMPATAPFEPDAATRATLDFLAGSTAPLVPPAGTIYLGAYVNYLKNLGPYETQTATFEKQIGRKLALHSEYYAFTDSFPSAEDVDDYRNGRVPVDSWDCGDTDYRVAQGKDDAVITKVAQNFKAYGFPIFLRYFWEMNLPTTALPRTECVDKVRDKNGYFNATDYVAAWQHIHAIFVAQGVKNVVWVWNPSGSLVVSPIPYYPGATETDWIGFDHYDLTGAGLQSTYSAPYNALTPLSKPIMIGETGTTSQYQSADISSAPTVLQADFPAVLAWTYFDSYGHRDDWRLSTAGIAAFKTAGATKYFSAFYKYKKK